jgi:hypothetical protein
LTARDFHESNKSNESSNPNESRLADLGTRIPYNICFVDSIRPIQQFSELLIRIRTLENDPRKKYCVGTKLPSTKFKAN